MVNEEIRAMVANHLADEHGIGWDIDGLIADASTIFPLPPNFSTDTLSELKSKQIEEKLIEIAETMYDARENQFGAENMRVLERLVMLRNIDNLWVEHLTMMENMRLQAGWQTLRQMRAVDAYKREGYKQFQVLLDTIQHDVVHTIYHVNIVKREASEKASTVMAQVAGAGSSQQRPRAGGKKIGRNQPCPCGSGKKYKHCHGR
jgi:preprotein translocase subunit SecA